jgi:hypothetical protein
VNEPNTADTNDTLAGALRDLRAVCACIDAGKARQLATTAVDRVEAAVTRALAGQPEPVPMVLHCPECRARHIDEGDFATKPHHTHACQGCGLVWRPAVVPTVGVHYLPGFKNPSPLYGCADQAPAAAQPSAAPVKPDGLCQEFGIESRPDSGLQRRPNYLKWNGHEWVDYRCGCRYHPDDDSGSHGGAPHVHRCERHAGPIITGE